MRLASHRERVSGFAGAATIVLDDNTIAHTPLAEIEMVMAHEIGHYVLNHAAKGVIFDGLVMGFGILLVAFGSVRLIARYGARWQVSGIGDIGALPVVWCLFGLWGYAALPATNGISRMHEAEADLYGLNAARHPVAMAEFMIRDADTGRLDPPMLDEWVFYTHPSPRRRILTAMRWRAENPDYD